MPEGVSFATNVKSSVVAAFSENVDSTIVDSTIADSTCMSVVGVGIDK
ncbi:hypothetical protein M565_ctg1P1260 [Vibrio cyclitrophicus FF75]|nr:hypothetical protein M565_ctg1P1260 [Vibrio cyclitrophicus FF75]